MFSSNSDIALCVAAAAIGSHPANTAAAAAALVQYSRPLVAKRWGEAHPDSLKVACVSQELLSVVLPCFCCTALCLQIPTYTNCIYIWDSALHVGFRAKSPSWTNVRPGMDLPRRWTRLWASLRTCQLLGPHVSACSAKPAYCSPRSKPCSSCRADIQEANKHTMPLLPLWVLREATQMRDAAGWPLQV